MYAHILPHQAGDPADLSGMIRLICFVSTPGEQVLFRRWATQLSEHIELLTVDAAPASDAEALATLVEELADYLDRPHALFAQGDSGPLAYAVARVAQRRFPGSTLHLFVSNCDAPIPSEPPLQVPLTALYFAGATPALLSWQDYSHRELELIEVPKQQPFDPRLQQRLVQIINTHLGLLSL